MFWCPLPTGIAPALGANVCPDGLLRADCCALLLRLRTLDDSGAMDNKRSRIPLRFLEIRLKGRGIRLRAFGVLLQVDEFWPAGSVPGERWLGADYG